MSYGNIDSLMDINDGLLYHHYTPLRKYNMIGGVLTLTTPSKRITGNKAVNNYIIKRDLQKNDITFTENLIEKLSDKMTNIINTEEDEDEKNNDISSLTNILDILTKNNKIRYNKEITKGLKPKKMIDEDENEKSQSLTKIGKMKRAKDYEENELLLPSKEKKIKKNKANITTINETMKTIPKLKKEKRLDQEEPEETRITHYRPFTKKDIDELKDIIIKEFNGVNNAKYIADGDGFGKVFEVVLRTSKEGKEVIKKLTDSNSVINTYDNYHKLTTPNEKKFFCIGDIYNAVANLEIKNFFTKTFLVNVSNRTIHKNGIKQNLSGIPIHATKFLGNNIFKGSETIPYFEYFPIEDKIMLRKIEHKGLNIIPHNKLDYYILMLAEDGIYYLDICDEVCYIQKPNSNLLAIDDLSPIFQNKKVEPKVVNGVKYNDITFYIPWDKWKKL